MDHGKTVNRFWQAGGGYDRNVFSDQALRKTIDYIHDNPVKAGIAEKPEEYRWSSARAWLIGKTDIIHVDILEWLRW